MVIDWAALVQLLIPQWMRRSLMISWLMVLSQPVRWLNAQFMTYRTSSLYDLGITGQVISLERMLNDRWDYVNRGIYIEPVADASQLYVYNKVEAQPALVMYNKWDGHPSYQVGEYALSAGQLWRCILANPVNPPSLGNATEWVLVSSAMPILHNAGEGVVAYDFIIHFPVGVVYDSNELTARMTTKKLAGKNYIAVTP